MLVCESKSHKIHDGYHDCHERCDWLRSKFHDDVRTILRARENYYAGLNSKSRVKLLHMVFFVEVTCSTSAQ